MSYKGEGPKLELKLNLSPSRDRVITSPAREESCSSEEMSCLSREASPGSDRAVRSCSGSPESGRSMILVGCPRCLMYVMLMGDDPKCPKCKSTVLLDFLHEEESKMGRLNK